MKLFILLFLPSVILAKPLSEKNKKDFINMFGETKYKSMRCMEGVIKKAKKRGDGTVSYELEDGEKFHQAQLYSVGQYVAVCVKLEKEI